MRSVSEAILRDFTVLFVEDDDDIRERLSSLLRRRVNALYTATNGREGLERFSEHRPDIVITDINMPVMNGIEMAEGIKKIDEQVPIIVITAYNEQDFFMRSIEIGIDKYLLKPVISENFLKAITEVATSLSRKREVERLRKALEDSMRQQSIAQLIRGLSHNFNNILVGIVGYAGLIRMKLSQIGDKENSELLRHINTIEQSAQRASELIRHLMVFLDRSRGEKHDINLNDMLKRLIETIRFSFPKNITIEASLEEGIPPINADMNRLEEAILNMCINAKEAMQDGGKLTIETFMSRDGGITLRISDTGCGMDEKTKRMIFDPFFTTKEIVNHLGLGLTVTMSTINQHDGFIMVESEPGKGSVFTVYLPASGQAASLTD